MVAFLGLGYFASQFAALFGDVVTYSRAVDVPSVKFLALFAFLGIVALAFLPSKPSEPTE